MKKIFTILLLACSMVSVSQWSNNPGVNTPVSTVANQQYISQMISDGSGGTIITFMEYSGVTNERHIYAQRISASGQMLWMINGAPICTATGVQSSPSVASDGNGGAIIAWQDNRNFYRPRIFVQRINAAGVVQWDLDGIAMGDGILNQSFVQVISDGSGGAFLTWHNSTTSIGTIQAQRINANGAIYWGYEGITVSSSIQASSPQLISDNEGGIIISWDEWVGTYPAGNRDIYAQRMDASGILQWGPAGTAVCSALTNQSSSQLVTDGGNGAIISWPDLRSGTGIGSIFVQKVNGAGIPQWTLDGIGAGTPTLNQQHQRLISDGAGGAFITWNNNNIVYAQRMLSTGAPAWTSAGKLIRAASGAEPEIVNDGATGSILSWSNGQDVFAQKLDQNGNFQWASAGVTICNASGNQFGQLMVESGTGNAIIAWYDYRNYAIAETDIYASKINGNGTLQDNIILPVKLVLFEAKKIDGGRILLHWQTSSEQNSSHFILERRSESGSFIEITNLLSSGNINSTTNYYFTDSTSLPEISYYRLKQVDQNGSYIYSAVIQVRKDKKLLSFSLYPNPANSFVELIFPGKNEYLEISLFDIQGRLVKKLITRNEPAIRIETNLLKPGIYFIRLSDGTVREEGRFIKQ